MLDIIKICELKPTFQLASPPSRREHQYNHWLESCDRIKDIKGKGDRKMRKHQILVWFERKFYLQSIDQNHFIM
jgi:hypothetical protein